MTSDQPVRAVIFDWAGTTIDHGSLAPVKAIRQLFAMSGVALTDVQIRRDMGLHKREHIRQLLQNADVQDSWNKATGRAPTDSDVERLFEDMLTVQIAVLADHSRVIPGVPETIQALRRRKIKIGSTTGYTRAMMAHVTTTAAKQGYAPDSLICPEDVGGGRPHPWMIYQACIEMRTYPLWQCVKIGDTVSDIEEGRNAGTWTVGVTRTGNLVGVSESEWAALSEGQKRHSLERATKQLREAGADFVLESAADIEPIIDEIEARQRRQEGRHLPR